MKINIEEAKVNLSDLVAKAAEGEEIIISDNGKPLVKLIQFDHSKNQRKLGIAKGKIEMAPDFDKELEDFKEYMF